MCNVPGKLWCTRPVECKGSHMTVKAYWWRGVQNFGDMLTAHLLQHYSGLTAAWAPVSDASLVGTGSILGHLPEDWNGHVLGSGKLFELDRVPIDARIWAVRGKLTAKCAPRPYKYALGDPGLLADGLVPRPVKKHKLGLVRHWSDQDLFKRREFLKFDPLLIDPCRDPLEVITDIGSCERIVSSSLHGIIVADSFGSPRRIEMTPRFRKEGWTYKFEDWNSAIGLEFKVNTMQQANRFRLNDARDALIDAFEAAGKHLKGTK